jgi:hypothetical protein
MGTETKQQAFSVCAVMFTNVEKGVPPELVAVCGDLAGAQTRCDREVGPDAEQEERDLYTVEVTPVETPDPLGLDGEWVLTSRGWRWLAPLDYGMQQVGMEWMPADPPEWKTGVGSHLVPRFKQVRPAYRLVEPEGRA